MSDWMAGRLAGWINGWISGRMRDWIDLPQCPWGVSYLLLSVLQLWKGLTKNLTQNTEEKGTLVFLFFLFILFSFSPSYNSRMCKLLRGRLFFKENSAGAHSFSSQDASWLLRKWFRPVSSKTRFLFLGKHNVLKNQLIWKGQFCSFQEIEEVYFI